MLWYSHKQTNKQTYVLSKLRAQDKRLGKMLNDLSIRLSCWGRVFGGSNTDGGCKEVNSVPKKEALNLGSGHASPSATCLSPDTEVGSRLRHMAMTPAPARL